MAGFDDDNNNDNELERNLRGDKEKSGDYEVGYGKPPKANRFQSGRSGNPSGRPKRILDFDETFLREARSLMTIHDGTRKRRVSKHTVVVRQIVNNAAKGSIPGQRVYAEHYLRASGKAAQEEAKRLKDEARTNVRDFSEEELMEILRVELARTEQEKKKGKK